MLNTLISSLALFQLTLPVWGATSLYWAAAATQVFQLTLPVWGATGKDHQH